MADSLLKINADDRILVCGMPQYRVYNQVYLEGEVKWPGIYPIQKEKTTLHQIIQKAGGFTEDADLHYSKIIRMNNRNTNEKITTWLKSFATTDLFSIERSYLKSQIIEDGGVVSLKLSQVEDSIAGFILQDGDRIIIARKALVVRVSGAVKFPGNVQYEEGKDYMYYIGKAGGFSSTATRSRVKVLKNDVASLLKPQEDAINQSRRYDLDTSKMIIGRQCAIQWTSSQLSPRQQQLLFRLLQFLGVDVLLIFPRRKIASSNQMPFLLFISAQFTYKRFLIFWALTGMLFTHSWLTEPATPEFWHRFADVFQFWLRISSCAVLCLFPDNEQSRLSVRDIGVCDWNDSIWFN